MVCFATPWLQAQAPGAEAEKPSETPAPLPQPDGIGPLFEKVYPKLDKTLDLVDKHEKLPDRTLIFGDDKRSNRARIDRLLDEAIDALEIGGIADLRATLRQVEQNIRASHQNITQYQRKRVSAPQEDTLNLLDKANPFVVTKEGYDKLIESERANIAAWEKDLAGLKAEFARTLKEIGLDLDAQAVDGLLSSVSGDDMVTLALVFDNVKRVTDQLEILTGESSEDPQTAKRYYGMYVVLVNILDRIQKQFIADIQDRHVPALEGYVKQADVNIEQARRLIRSGGGDEAALLNNIAANETTRETATLYVAYLIEQAEMVRNENKSVERTLATAMNTYQTVKLSSDVAALIQAGRESFDTLMRLRLPYLREFRNEAIRREFQRMTESLKSGR